MADKKIQTTPERSEPGTAAETEKSLGQFITKTRERKGLSREQVVLEAHLPAHYVQMIETDNYGLISDQLYVVPFLRKYASFLGLDAEEVASRFVRDVQHAESNVIRISHPLTMVTKRSRFPRRFAIGVLVLVVIVLIADFAWRRLSELRDANPPAPIASPSPATPPATVPPAPVSANPSPSDSNSASIIAPAVPVAMPSAPASAMAADSAIVAAPAATVSSAAVPNAAASHSHSGSQSKRRLHE